MKAMERQVEYNQRSRKRKREAGLVPVEVWVPKERKQAIREVAEQMRWNKG